MSLVGLQRDGHIATVVLNRPEKHNAIPPEMAAELAEVVREVNRDRDIRVVVMRGAGQRAFCAGSDIKALDQYPTPWDYRVRTDDYTRLTRSIRKPVIAMIYGWCLGGGLEIAVNCDIRYAAENARFGAPEVTHGWIGGGGASQILPRLCGAGHALELLLTGDAIDAATALDIGLVERVFAMDQLEAATYELAAKIARNAPLATQVIKHAVRMAQNTAVEIGLEYENELVHVTFSTEDKAEGVRAFVEKRTPDFHGR